MPYQFGYFLLGLGFTIAWFVSCLTWGREWEFDRIYWSFVLAFGVPLIVGGILSLMYGS